MLIEITVPLVMLAVSLLGFAGGIIFKLGSIHRDLRELIASHNDHEVRIRILERSYHHGNDQALV